MNVGKLFFSKVNGLMTLPFVVLTFICNSVNRSSRPEHVTLFIKRKLAGTRERTIKTS